jgi:hypothetical protein
MYGLSNDNYVISSNITHFNSSKWTRRVNESAFKIVNGGSGYLVGQFLNISGSTSVAKVASTNVSGSITGITLVSGGNDIEETAVITVNNNGTGLVLDLDVSNENHPINSYYLNDETLINGGKGYVAGQSILIGNTSLPGYTGYLIINTVNNLGSVTDITYNDYPGYLNSINYQVIPLSGSGAIIKYSKEKEIIYNNNNVGIGKTNPVYRLDVANESTYSPSSTYRYFNYSTALTQVTTAGNIGNTCAKFGSDIWVEGTIAASSDTRIKNNVNDINDDSALQKILSISPKTYNYIDFINRGSNLVYGFLAQQIKEVIPEAVSIETQFIPNIYSLCEVDGSNLLLNSNIYTSNLKVSDKLLIYIDEKSLEISIKEISSNKIEIDTEINDSNVFVYGTKINDFHTLNKSYIYTLNVCATQELYKIMQEQQNTITNLLAKINEIETKINS